MTLGQDARGGAPIGVLDRMEAWEANLVLNLRLWCDGPGGQDRVWDMYTRALPDATARCECERFGMLVRTLVAFAQRPLVRHDVGCTCVGADEGVFVHLVRCASSGHLNDAAMMAGLIALPAHAERIAILAGQVGTCARKIHDRTPGHTFDAPPRDARIH